MAVGKPGAKPKPKRVTGADGNVQVHGKAANGSGSAYYEKARSRWVAQRVVHQNDGGTKTVRAYGPTRQQAETRLGERLQDLYRPDSDFTRATRLEQYATWWLALKTPELEATSVGRYKQRVERINGYLGRVPLGQLTSEHVRSALAEMGNKLAPGTVGDTRSVLAQITRSAFENELIDRDPVARVPAPKVPAKTRRALTVPEVRALVSSADGHRLGAAVVLLFTVGLRASEVLGLRWQDVDFAEGSVRVVQAAKYLEGTGPVLGAPKTSGALGVHRLPRTAAEELKRHKARQAAEQLAASLAWSDEYDGLVFRTSDGGIVLRQTLTKAVATVAKAAGVDPKGLGTHGGRRTVVTLAYSAGLDLDDVRRHVGHADRRTTEGYVQHLGRRPETTAAAIDALITGR